MVGGLEISQLVADYEAASGSKDIKKNSLHHNQSKKAQKTLLVKVNQLTMIRKETLCKTQSLPN